MEKINVDAINKTSISGAASYCFAAKPLWLIATNGENTYTLNCRNHNHAFYELHIIASGRLVYGFGNEELVLCDSLFTVIPPHRRHKVQSHSKSIEKFTLAFEADEDSRFALAMDKLADKAHTLTQSQKHCFEEILSLCDSKSDYKTERIYLLLCNLLFEIAQTADVKAKSTPHRPETDDRVFKAKKYIEDNFDIFFSCQEVAAYCRISEKQLGRLFIKHEGTGLLDFIHGSKMQMIAKLMSRNTLTHSQIAEQLGFSSVQYYGKFIQRMTGMSPEQYKKHLRQT